MTRDEITSLVQSIGDIMQAIKDADPADKAEIYSQLGLTLTYHPNEKRVVAEARPASITQWGENAAPGTGEPGHAPAIARTTASATMAARMPP
jgi:hypothetical protein